MKMTEIRGVVFGAAYESWLKLSKKFKLDSSDVLLHLFQVHDECCKDCTSTEGFHQDYTSASINSPSRTDSPSEVSATSTTHGSNMPVPENVLTPNRRRQKPKRFLSEYHTNLTTQTPVHESNADQCSEPIQVKQEVVDSEFYEPSSGETHREPAVDHVDVYMSEEVDDQGSPDTNSSSQYRETLIDRIDVYIKEEPEDSEMSSTSSLGMTERSSNMSLDQDLSASFSLEGGSGPACMPSYQHQSQFAYIDDGISAEKLPKFNWRRKRGFYEQYSPEDKAKIAKYAIDNGIANAVRRFSTELNKQVRESTVREFKKKYLSQTEGQRGEILAKIESKPRGRPKVILPAKPKPPPLPPGERRKRGEYQRYSPEIKATLAKYAIDLGCAKAAKYFSKLMNRNINESTIRSFRRSYLEQANGGDLHVLESRKRGRPKPKPYSAKVIDHLIEYGTFPSNESCGKFLEDNSVDDGNELEEKTLDEMRKTLASAYQESEETVEGNTSSLRLSITEEEEESCDRQQSESDEWETEHCEDKDLARRNAENDSHQGSTEKPVKCELGMERLVTRTDKKDNEFLHNSERSGGSRTLKFSCESDSSESVQHNSIKIEMDETNFQSAIIEIS